MKQQHLPNFHARQAQEPSVNLKAKLAADVLAAENKWKRANGYPESRQAPRRTIPYPTSKDEAVALVQSLLSEHFENRLDRLCARLHERCLKIDRDPFTDVAAFFYVAHAVGKPSGKPPPDPGALAASKVAAHRECHLKLVRILQELIKTWGFENRFLGFGALWHVGLADAEFLRLCGLKRDGQCIHPGDIDESDRYGLNERVAKHDACVILGIMRKKGATAKARDAIRQHFKTRNVSALIEFAEYPDGRGVHLPTVYRVAKSAPQIENLKALKKVISRLELNEEPIPGLSRSSGQVAVSDPVQ